MRPFENLKSGFQTTFWFRGADQFAIGFYGSECHRRGKAAEVDSVSLDEMVEVICSQGGQYVWGNQYSVALPEIKAGDFYNV